MPGPCRPGQCPQPAWDPGPGPSSEFGPARPAPQALPQPEHKSGGTDVLAMTEKEPEDREDPMARVFPKVTKCTFHKFGPSGTIQRHDAQVPVRDRRKSAHNNMVQRGPFSKKHTYLLFRFNTYRKTSTLDTNLQNVLLTF